MGRDFYGRVAGDPQMGAPWAECDEMCHFFAHLHCQRFGGYPDTRSGLSRESGQNLACWLGWSSLAATPVLANRRAGLVDCAWLVSRASWPVRRSRPGGAPPGPGDREGFSHREG